MSDIQIRPDFLPVISPKEVCLMFQKARNHGIYDHTEGVVKGMPDHHRCGIAYLTVFQGLFDEIGFDQHMLDNKTFADMSDTLMLQKVYETIAELGGPIRLAIKKYVDENGKHRYAKYVDFDADKVIELGGKEELKRIIYLLIHACDTDGMLVPKVDESWTKEDTCQQTTQPQIEQET